MALHGAVGHTHSSSDLSRTQVLPVREKHRRALAHTQTGKRSTYRRIAEQFALRQRHRPTVLPCTPTFTAAHVHPRRVRNRAEEVGACIANLRPRLIASSNQASKDVGHEISRVDRSNERRRVPHEVDRPLTVRLLQRARNLHTPTMPQPRCLGDICQLLRSSTCRPSPPPAPTVAVGFNSNLADSAPRPSTTCRPGTGAK